MQHFLCSNSGVRVFSLSPADAATATAAESESKRESEGSE